MQLAVFVLGVRGTSVVSGYVRVTLLAKDEVSADAAQGQGEPVLLLLPYTPLANSQRIELELALWDNAAGRHHMKASGEALDSVDNLPDSEDDADAVWYTLFDEDTPAGEVCLKLWLAEHDSTTAVAEQQQQAHTTASVLTAEQTAADEADAEGLQALLFDADGTAADVQAAPFDADESSLFDMSQDTSRTGTAVSFGSDDDLALQGVIHAADQQLLAATKTLTPHREAAAAARAAAATAADETATSGFFNADDLSLAASLFMTGFLDGDTVDDTDVIAAAEPSAVDLSLLHDGAFDLTAALRSMLPRYAPGSARLEVRASSITIAATATAAAAAAVPLYLRVTLQPGAQAMARSGDASTTAVHMLDTAAQQWQQHTLPDSAPLSLPVPSSAAAVSTLTSRSSSNSSKRDRPPTLKLEAVGQRSIAHCEIALSQLLRAPDTCVQRSALPLLSRTSSANDAGSGSMLVGSVDVQFRVVVQGSGQRGSVNAASARKRSRNNSLSASTGDNSNSSSVPRCAVVTVCVSGVRSSSSSSSNGNSSDTAYCTLAAELLCSGARSSHSLSSSSSATVCLALESTDVDLDVLSLCLAQCYAPPSAGKAVGTAVNTAAEALYIPVADIAAIWGSEQGSAKWIALPARSQRSTNSNAVANSSNNNSSSVRRNTNTSSSAAAGADAGQHTIELLLWVGVHSDSSITAAATTTTTGNSSPVHGGATSTALRLTAADSISNGNRLSAQGGRRTSRTAAGLQQHRRLVAAAAGAAAAAAGTPLSHSGSVASHTTAGSSQMQQKRVRIALASPPPPPGLLEVEVRPRANC
jgi:hypothetical protein